MMGTALGLRTLGSLLCNHRPGILVCRHISRAGHLTDAQSYQARNDGLERRAIPDYDALLTTLHAIGFFQITRSNTTNTSHWGSLLFDSIRLRLTDIDYDGSTHSKKIVNPKERSHKSPGIEDIFS